MFPLYNLGRLKSKLKNENFLTIVISSKPSVGFGYFVTLNPPPEYLQIPNIIIKHSSFKVSSPIVIEYFFFL